MSRWQRAFHEGVILYDVGVNQDGSLHNPNGYPDETVRAAVEGAEERRRQHRSKAAQKAAATRRRRTQARTYEVARRIVDGEVFGPSDHCDLCGRGLADPESIERGIGSECWQFVLDIIRPAAR